MANQKQVFKVSTHLNGPPDRVYEDPRINFSQFLAEELPC